MERALFLEAGEPLPAGGSWERIYVGSEFCRWLLPGAGELSRALDVSGKRGWRVTLATPPLTDGSLEQVGALLEGFRGSGLEVAVNDWGLLELARASGWDFSLALGRLLVHSSAGPAAQQSRHPQGERGGKDGAVEPEQAANYLASSSLSSPGFIDYLRSVGVGRAEIDDPAHRAAGPLALSLHWPDRYVTLAARCPWRFNGSRWETGPCPGPCRGREFTMTRAEDGLEIRVRGRAQILPGAVDPRGGDMPGVDRLVRHGSPEGRR